MSALYHAYSARNEIIAQPWFDYTFSIKLEEAIGGHQFIAKRIEHVVRGSCCELHYYMSDYESAELPRRLSKGPWTLDEMLLTKRLLDWGAIPCGDVNKGSDTQRKCVCLAILKQAVEEDRTEIVELFLKDILKPLDNTDLIPTFLDALGRNCSLASIRLLMPVVLSTFWDESTVRQLVMERVARKEDGEDWKFLEEKIFRGYFTRNTTRGSSNSTGSRSSRMGSHL